MKNLIQKLISFALVITMSMGVATLPAFASTYPDTQSSNNISWYVSWQGTSRSISRGQSIANILANMAYWLDSDAQALYNRMGGLSSDIQDVVDAIGAIPGATDYSTVLSSIDSKIKDYTNNFASVENKLQSIINNLVNVNTGLTNIKGDTSSIVTNTNNINTGVNSLNTFLTNKIGDYLSLGNWLSVYKTSTNTNQTGNTVNQNSIPVLRYKETGGDTNKNYVTDVYPYTTRDGIMSYLGALNQNMYMLSTSIKTPVTSYNINTYHDNVKTEYSNRKAPLSIMDMLSLGINNINQNLGNLQYMLADDDTIAAKNANKPQEQSVLTNFTGSGDASASVSDFVGVKDSVSALKTSLSGGASYTQAFNILGGDSDGWSWFTTEVAESMDSTGNGSTRRGGVSYSTPYLDSYYDSIYSIIGVNGGIE